ncbi:glycosyl transferase family 4 [Candidatus Pacearchaeota archaeon]|nr:glycosyl transferase family 4 [Candidatus Pacearchaeota archaeon]|tara:strand:- start:9844 stop:10860 length:1017 start_codon:yes stop_codon:yes gene_type:complete
MIINTYLLIPILVSFFITLFLMPFWIRKTRQIGLLWDDVHKLKKQKVSGSGGIIAVLGFIIGVLVFIAFRVFYLKSHNSFLVELLALLTVTLTIAGLGLIDDLLGWQRGGLSRRSRLILIALASIPLIAINAGSSTISVPFFGQLNLGIIYPLILIPLGIVGAATTYNFLAGYNGLEAGQGIIILTAISIVAFFTGNSWISVVALCMSAALFAFLFYNFFPAKVFPGDSLTLAVGGLIAILAILGNFERIAVFFFIPYILETVLKARGKLVKHSFGIPQNSGFLKPKYNKIYSLSHIAIRLLNKTRFKATEKSVVYSIWIFQIIIILLGFLIFKQGIF